MESVNIIDITTKGTKEVHEVGVAVKDLISSFKQAKADGWQPGTDIPTILMGSFKSFTDALEGLDKAGAEVKQETVKAVMGALIPVAEGVEMLMEKEADAES